jgi:hypothetical protein
MAMLTVGSEDGARVELYYEDRGRGLNRNDRKRFGNDSRN